CCYLCINSDCVDSPGYCLPPPCPPEGRGRACGAIWDCVFQQSKSRIMCEAGKPQAAQDALAAASNCIFITYCGDTADASAGQKCADGMLITDAGLSTCNDCINNTVNGPMSFFVDQNGQHPPCVPTTAPECGQCVSVVESCLKQCFTDADCAGFTTPLTCMGASGVRPGTCQ